MKTLSEISSAHKDKQGKYTVTWNLNNPRKSQRQRRMVVNMN